MFLQLSIGKALYNVFTFVDGGRNWRESPTANSWSTFGQVEEGDVSVKDAHAMGPFFLVSDISGREFYTRIFLQKKV